MTERIKPNETIWPQNHRTRGHTEGHTYWTQPDCKQTHPSEWGVLVLRPRATQSSLPSLFYPHGCALVCTSDPQAHGRGHRLPRKGCLSTWQRSRIAQSAASPLTLLSSPLTFLSSLLFSPVDVVLELDADLPLVGLVSDEGVLHQLLRGWSLAVVLH